MAVVILLPEVLLMFYSLPLPSHQYYYNYCFYALLLCTAEAAIIRSLCCYYCYYCSWC